MRWMRYLICLAALAALSATIARGDIILTATETGQSPVGPVTLATGSPATPGGVVYAPGTSTTFNNFRLTSLAMSEMQTAAISEVLSATLTITNTGSVAHTISLVIQATGFTAPLAPPGAVLTSSVGGTSPITGSGPPNALSFTSQAGAAPPAPTLTPDVTGAGTAYSATTGQTITAGLAAPYAINQTYLVTLNPGANLQYTGRTFLTAIPEPDPLTMSLVSLPLLGLFLASRRLRARFCRR